MTVVGVSDFAVAMNPKKWVTTCAVVLAMTATLMAQTTRPDRIAQGATAGGLVTVKGTMHPLAKQATDMGAVNSQIKMESLTLNTNLSATQQTDLDTLLAAQQNPKSSLYHHWLTQEQFGARFGLTDADLKAVTSWLTSQGFTVTGVSKSRNSIHFSGRVWQVESAFHTQIHRMQLNGREHVANVTELQLPAGLASVFLNVRGLDNFRPQPRVQKRQQPAYSVSDGTNTYNFLSPTDWATIYDVTPIYSQTCSGSACDGTGMHVGVVGQTNIYKSDIANFRSAAGLSTSITYLNSVCIDSSTSRCTSSSSYSTTGDLGEADLDIEWAGGIAKNATVDYIYAPYEDACANSGCTASVADPNTALGFYSAFDALEYAVKEYTVSGSVLPVISMSYGDCEAFYADYPSNSKTGNVNWVQWIGQQANAQGQTLVTSSGDDGPFTCEGSNYPAESGVYVDIPADSPNFTGVGGTRLSGDESNPTAYWNDNSTAAGTALGYISETVWNDTAENVASGSQSLSASGGGVSTVFSQPSWQNQLVSGQTSHRMVPDVSFAASADHDGYLICSTDDNNKPVQGGGTSGTDCGHGFLSSNYDFGGNVYGGTSASSPSFAGMLTLIVQKYGNQGNINTVLYPLATSGNYSTIFHAVSGNNITPCKVGSADPGCPSSAQFGYTAPGSFPYYSMAAGLGSIDGFNLFSALGGGGGTGTSNSYVMTPSATALTIAAGATTGNTVTFALSSTAYTGTINLTATSSSSLVTATLSSNTVSLASGAQSVTLTISPGASAANRAPRMPWKGGGVMVLAALLGVPFTLRRKRALAVLLTALAISCLGFMAACGGGSGSSSNTTKQARTYTVTVTGTATGTGSSSVTNPAAVVVTVTVP